MLGNMYQIFLFNGAAIQIKLFSIPVWNDMTLPRAHVEIVQFAVAVWHSFAIQSISKSQVCVGCENITIILICTLRVCVSSQHLNIC